MLKSSTISLTCVAGLAVFGCSTGERAVERELTAARDALAAVDSAAQEYVTDEVRAIQEALDSAAARIERGDYQEALTAARDARTRATDLPDAVVESRAELEASWTVLRDSLPSMLQQIDAQVNRLSNARQLPAGMSTVQVTAAKATLQELNETWAEAVRESEGDQLPRAVTKAESVRTGVMQLMRSLGLRTT